MIIGPNVMQKNVKIENIIAAIEMQHLPINRKELNRIHHLIEELIQGIGFVSNRKQIGKLQDELESIGFSKTRKLALVLKLREMISNLPPSIL